MAIVSPPSLNFTNKNTPIQPIRSFTEQYKNYNFWVKRDDLTGTVLSGNKVRKLDFILKDALEQKATHIITCGGLQSNHCRTASYMAARVGLQSILFLRGKKEKNPTGNYFLNRIIDTEIIYVTDEEYNEIDTLMFEKSKELENINRKAYIIPEGGSNALGAWGYISCFQEICYQIEKQSLPIELVIVATGSGGTHAGLLLGKLLIGSCLDIISINVTADAKHFRKKIYSILTDFSNSYQITNTIQPEDIIIHDGFVGEGYGKLSDVEIGIIKNFARHEGILLDPVYTAKAIAGLKSLVSTKKIEQNNILFIHTGGIFSLFPYSKLFT